MTDGAPRAIPAGAVLITGAAGFVGRHLVRSLCDAWPDAVLATPAIDVCDTAAISACLRDTAPSVCIHLAAISSVAEASQDQAQAWRVNLHGALAVAHAILADAPACQLIYASSADAYGSSFRSGTALDETAPLAPLNVYGATKAAADLALGSLAAQGLHVVRLRPFNHIGPGQSPDFVVSSFARQIARIEAKMQPPVLQVGRLETYRDFLDVRDVCAAYTACIVRRGELEPGTILNIASGKARRISDVLADLVELSGVTLQVKTETPRVRAGDIPCATGDASRAGQVLGWRPTTPWHDTLASVLEDWRERVKREG